ncbi:MAG: M1 family metallopeptidase [Flavobacteriales bacterium]|nr:M1 family metallopeptidase [Flavobacteriales bacterium]
MSFRPIHPAIPCLAFLLCGLAANAQHTCKEKHAYHPSNLRDGAQASRSDSIDLLHTRIALDLTQVAGGTIAGAAAIRFAPRLNGIADLPLDLLDLTVDSVIMAGSALAFGQAGETLTIDLGAPYGIGDTLELTVHYQGDPATDASGWGGFYTSGTVIYNLGVAFAAIPHSYGRAWFPCFDNFVERSTFEFIVRTHQQRHAWCNGRLLGETDLGGGFFESHWLLEETIPSYLASVTASTYTAARDTLLSITGQPVPMDLVARPQDTTAMKNSFIHLPDAFACFEHWFGAHQWERVGYCLTPQGAMEHPTNISYPSSIANGTLQYEGTMAHELAHHWFGDQVTCSRAEEMYINEGFAEYLSFLFLEHVYGAERYRRTVRDNHRQMVHKAHLIDQGWWALADVPQAHTYGEHSYNKGADVLHTLRSYLGDSLFRAGLTTFVADHAFSPVSSSMLRDDLSATTGVDLTDFFNDWIFQPGWAAFEVDSFVVAAPVAGVYPTDVFVEQKLRGPASLYHNVPVTITCVAPDQSRWDHDAPVMLGNASTIFTITPPFAPVAVLLNANERISLAITADEDTLTATGTVNYTNGNLRLTVNALPSAAPLRVEQYWVAADEDTDPMHLFVPSPDRWWRVTGSIPAGADINASITFDGNNTAGGGLDIGLMEDLPVLPFREDSLVLLYRSDARSPWALFPTFTVNTQGSATNRIGRVEFTGFVTGDYALGKRISATGMRDRTANPAQWNLVPNPAQERFELRAANADALRWQGRMEVMDPAGRLVHQLPFQGSTVEVNCAGWARGTYTVVLRMMDGNAIPAGQVVLR